MQQIMRVSNPSSGFSSFPTPTLVALSVASCFFAGAALLSSFTQVTGHFAYFIVPSTIGYLATIPYHGYMYICTKSHERNSNEEVFISNEWIIYNFLLITLWTVIFIIDILFCVNEGTVGVIAVTVMAGLEWITLLLLAVITLVEIRRRGTTLLTEVQPLLDAEAGEASKASTPLLPVHNTKFIYFVSYTLCTLTLVLSVDVHFPVLFSVIAFFLTAPHHIALYIVSARPTSADLNFLPVLGRPTHVAYASFLSVLWIGFTVLDIILSGFAYQSVLLGIFGGLESGILIYLFVHRVLDNIQGGQIRL